MIPSTSIPIVSAVFFVVIGALIGHLLWYRYEEDADSKLESNRDRDAPIKPLAALAESEDTPGLIQTTAELVKLRQANERLEKQWHELKSESEQLKSKLTYSQHEYQEVNDQAIDQTSRINELEKGLEQAIAELEERQKVHAELELQRQRLEADRLTLNQEIADLSNQLVEQSDQSRGAESRFMELKANAAKYESEAIVLADEKSDLLERITSERDSRTAANARLVASQSQVEELKFEIEQLTIVKTEFEESASLVTNLQSRIAKLTAERDDATRLGNTHERGLFDVQEQLKRNSESENSLRNKVDQLTSALQIAQKERDGAIESAKIQQAETHKLKKDSDELLLLRESHQRMQQKLDEANHSFIRLTAEIESSNSKLAETEANAAELNLVTSKKQDELEIANELNRRLEEELKDARSKEMALRGENDSFRTKISSQLVSRDVVNQLQETIKSEKERLTLEQQKRIRMESELNAKDEELSHLRNRITQVEPEIQLKTQLQTELAKKTEYAQNLSKQLHEAIETEHTTKEIVAELRAELNDRLETLEVIQQEKDAAVANFNRIKQQNSELTQQLQSRAQISDQEIKRLTEKVGEQEKEMRKIRRDRNHLKKQQEEGRSDRHFISLSNVKSQASGKELYDEPDKVKFDDQLGAIYSKRPKQVDDLKEISGIASILERKLNKIGIFKFQQIMRWDDCSVEEVSKLLSFGDRIQRDNWIGQARRLYREHHVNKAA